MPGLQKRFPAILPFAVLVLLAGSAVWAARNVDSKQNAPAVKFARNTIDVGIVVSDIEKSVAFYKDVLGFTELDGFDVPAGFAGDTGLSDQQPFHVHVLVLGEADDATKIKLMQFKDAPGKKTETAFIHSSLGISYLTIFVEDVAAAVARAKHFATSPLAKGPVALPAGFPADVYLACVKDPDGNIIELVGPSH